jgi:beta-glucosidase/6-phospho-beta-glucosidase/beta-galactosidase
MTCIQYGVTPMVTLMHIDNPALVSPEDASFREHFLHYAKQVLTRFADRVPIWITFNEPNLVGYSFGDVFLLPGPCPTYSSHTLMYITGTRRPSRAQAGSSLKISSTLAPSSWTPRIPTKSRRPAATNSSSWASHPTPCT